MAKASKSKNYINFISVAMTNCNDNKLWVLGTNLPDHKMEVGEKIERTNMRPLFMKAELLMAQAPKNLYRILVFAHHVHMTNPTQTKTLVFENRKLTEMWSGGFPKYDEIRASKLTVDQLKTQGLEWDRRFSVKINDDSVFKELAFELQKEAPESFGIVKA